MVQRFGRVLTLLALSMSCLPIHAEPTVDVAASLDSFAIAKVDYEKWKAQLASDIEHRVFRSAELVAPQEPVRCKLYLDEDGEVSAVQVTKSPGDRKFEDVVVSRLVGAHFAKPPEIAVSAAILTEFKNPRSVQILVEDH